MNAITDPAAGIVAEVAAPVKKTCTKCGVEKVLEEFYPQEKGKFGRHSRCRACQRDLAREYWRRPEVKERQQAYRQRPDVKERKQAYMRDYRWTRPQRDYRRNYARDRHRTDPAFRLKNNLRTRILDALKEARKSARTLELLGCTVEELRAHIEAQFKPGMTWENQGRYGWHVDHIRPCASFDMSDPEQQRLCFHYTNLQPLWAKENMSKGAKFSLTPLRRPE